MIKLKKTLSCMLAALLVLGIAACGNDSETGSKKPKPPKNESSVSDTSSDNSSEDGTSSDTPSEDSASSGSDGVSSGSDDGYDYTVSRDPYESDEETAREHFNDTDGDFDYKTVKWAGPSGYTIVVPNGDTHAREAAEYLQDYYVRVHNVTLNIVTDTAKASDKEILIGKTNRSESNRSLSESELEVALKGNKLVFSGGHYVTTEAAVKRFTRLMPDKNEAFTFKLKTDFSSTVDFLDDYEYVWGDEFEDWYDIDFGKWNFRLGMAGNTVMETSTDRDVIDVSDGRLKLTPCYVFDPSNKDLEFKVPWSVATDATMNYVYGYAEIRARVPFYDGIWPSFWGGTGCDLKAPRNPNWHAEIDVFENFGTTDSLRPNIHKWYDTNLLNELFGLDPDERAHFQYPKRNTYTFANPENLSNEYHIYGYEWTPTEMNIYIDGEKYMTFDIVNSFDANPDMSMFQDPQYNQFNCHVYSNGDSNPPSLIYDNLDLLPAAYYIDYFRLYQKKPGSVDYESELYTDTSKRGQEPNNRKKAITLD